MEGAPVTAATGVLGPVVAKLGALLGSGYKLRHRTRKDVNFIKSKLKLVHCILWAVWEREDLDAESKVLKKEALDLANGMHDAVDDFILTMECSRGSKHLMIQSKIKASPFQGFRAGVDDVSARCCSKWKWKKNKCAQPISSLFSRKDTKSSAPGKTPSPRAPFVRKDAAELVGMARWGDHLIKYLVGGGGEEEKETTTVPPQLKMASIVGMAGVGKTTLAHLVYEDEKIKSTVLLKLIRMRNRLVSFTFPTVGSSFTAIRVCHRGELRSDVCAPIWCSAHDPSPFFCLCSPALTVFDAKAQACLE
ncbi:disease resistance protein PIK5-NP-like [Triticum dicoccoides]|uniref:disease resistance protein PIK5-NP-like n=1 Tax=Triticum dicoccoides TaxID=85692 RepID=UPI0018905805|nr:disease resistance protein PIK5-NP-like [Triticum dicoccoides]